MHKLPWEWSESLWFYSKLNPECQKTLTRTSGRNTCVPEICVDWVGKNWERTSFKHWLRRWETDTLSRNPQYWYCDCATRGTEKSFIPRRTGGGVAKTFQRLISCYQGFCERSLGELASTTNPMWVTLGVVAPWRVTKNTRISTTRPRQTVLKSYWLLKLVREASHASHVAAQLIVQVHCSITPLFYQNMSGSPLTDCPLAFLLFNSPLINHDIIVLDITTSNSSKECPNHY